MQCRQQEGHKRPKGEDEGCSPSHSRVPMRGRDGRARGNAGESTAKPTQLRLMRRMAGASRPFRHREAQTNVGMLQRHFCYLQTAMAAAARWKAVFTAQSLGGSSKRTGLWQGDGAQQRPCTQAVSERLRLKPERRSSTGAKRDLLQHSGVECGIDQRNPPEYRDSPSLYARRCHARKQSTTSSAPALLWPHRTSSSRPHQR